MGVYAESDKNKEIQGSLLSPHYTNHAFREPQTVFLDPEFKVSIQFGSEMVEGAEYVYSDRLSSWYDYETREKARKKVKDAGFVEKTAAFLEAYLRELMKNANLRLIHIVAGLNVSNGYPYQALGFLK